MNVQTFLRYIDRKAAEGAFVQALDREVRRVKQHDETRREYMTLAMELKRQKREGFLQGKAEGIAEGKEKERMAMIAAMLAKGFPIDIIAECTKVTEEYVIEAGKAHHIL